MTPEEFRKLAAAEDRMWYFHALHRHLWREVEKARRPGTSSPLLVDVGCGTGGWLRRVHAWGPEWRTLGLDESADACALARAAGSGDVREGRLETPPISPGEAEVVTCADVLYMVEDPLLAMKSLAALVRPGGTVIVTAPAYAWLWSYHDEAVGGRRRFRRRDLLALAEAAGLQVRTATYWNALTFPLVVLRRKWLKPAAGQGDVGVGPSWLESLLRAVMAMERAWIGVGGVWPWGATLLIAARRG